ncbi:MAG TPA: hypothetical protein VMC07_01575 [Candidatus Omnitrophota bacterium]|nr:hypothetical protein [Candidatus Omnitrophota bacterium]
MDLTKITLDNKEIFRGKDIGFLKEVREYIQGYGFFPELRGGVVKNALRGNPRSYNDIDLAVRTDDKPMSDLAYRKYVELIKDLYSMSKAKHKNPRQWRVENETEVFANYVDLEVEYRFRIKSPETRTSIDIAFGREHKSSILIPYKTAYMGPPGAGWLKGKRKSR